MAGFNFAPGGYAGLDEEGKVLGGHLPFASEADAAGAVDNTRIMTPLRTAEMIAAAGGGDQAVNGEVLDALSEIGGQLAYRGVMIGGGGGLGGLLSVAKSKIAAGEEVAIQKEYDPAYRSLVLGVQEFINTGLTDVAEVARVYDNNSASSFEPNPNLLFASTGLSLIRMKTLKMEALYDADSEYIFIADVDGGGFEDWSVM